jgi:hypothetical protein
MRDKTAVLCGKPSEFSAKLFNKSPNPLKQKLLGKIHGTNWVVTTLASGKWAQKQPPYKGIWRKNGDENNKMRDKTAVLCGKPSEFSAKLFNKSPNPLKQKLLGKIHGTNWVVTTLASGKWAQKQPPYKGIWGKNGDKNNKMRDKMVVLCGKPSKFRAKICNKNPNPLKQKSLSKIHGTNWDGDHPSLREMGTKTAAL